MADGEQGLPGGLGGVSTDPTTPKQTVDDYLKQYGGPNSALSKNCDPECSAAADEQKRQECYKTCIKAIAPLMDLPEPQF
ncbi:hypothetical protein O0I10_011751 [Lichtheimia ornata]|uniref:Uncharacterized protein n=1 Tax=Lichtheimia ornata TaxID=688661 RepID=A0AAD7UUB1_9FUNG|nr:uncharacterized protein O0I10_011751 [Lichtheimia ornata]KAJ8652605.1 hypothetical protein O0I10_011751 [Lichtheimia ornata]